MERHLRTYIDAYFEVMDKLNVRRAHVYPRVSEHMQEIINVVQTLIDKAMPMSLMAMYITALKSLTATANFPDASWKI